MTNYPGMPFHWALASAPGRSHLAAGLTSDDAMSFCSVIGSKANTWIIAVVADGAGSTARGGDGARLAVDTVRQSLSRDLWRDEHEAMDVMIRRACETARASIETASEAEGLAVGDFATTIQVALSNGLETVVAQIGDGLALAGPDWTQLVARDRGGYVNETSFLTCAGWADRLVIARTRASDRHIVLATDGIGDLLIDPDGHAHSDDGDRVIQRMATT